jgi:hypothetical protein
VTKGVCVLALFGILCVAAGCRGDDNEERPASFSIVTDIDFTSDPIKGTFRVKQGSEELGCSGGTFVDHPLGSGAFGQEESSGAILKVLTCTGGERSGSFLIRFEIAFSRWTFLSGTDDFAGVKGKGKYSNPRRPGPELSGVETLTGTVRFS